MSEKAKIRQGKKDPKHMVVAIAAMPLDRAMLLAQLAAAKSVEGLAQIVATIARSCKL